MPAPPCSCHVTLWLPEDWLTGARGAVGSRPDEAEGRGRGKSRTQCPSAQLSQLLQLGLSRSKTAEWRVRLEADSSPDFGLSPLSLPRMASGFRSWWVGLYLFFFFLLWEPVCKQTLAALQRNLCRAPPTPRWGNKCLEMPEVWSLPAWHVKVSWRYKLCWCVSNQRPWGLGLLRSFIEPLCSRLVTLCPSSLRAQWDGAGGRDGGKTRELVCSWHVMSAVREESAVEVGD